MTNTSMALRPLLGALATASLLAAAPALAGEVRFSGDGHAQNPVWSLDGKHLAFEVNPLAGNVDLYVSSVSGDIAKDGTKVALPGGSNPFGGGSQVVANPTWHPQGVTVFEGSNQGGQYRLYYYAPGGGAAAEMITTQEIPGNLTFPNVSADGNRMTFVASATGSGDIRIRDSQTGSVSQVTSTPDSEAFPQFSPDGKSILFTRKQNNSEDVFLINIDTGAESKVAGGGGDQTRPIYADGGKILFFDNSRDSEEWDLAVIDGPGGSKKILAKDVRLPQRARPAITPDGKYVAFGYNDPTKNTKITIMAVDGSKTSEVATSFTACGEPALTSQGGKTLLAYTALPSSGANWRFLYVVDVSSQL